ncbi:hypothetical protein K438DRAFT_1589891, partial [Mycena galopus ATCC 62051]
DEITIAEFMLDYSHKLRPARPAGTPWLVEDKTGRKVARDEVRQHSESSKHYYLLSPVRFGCESVDQRLG